MDARRRTGAAAAAVHGGVERGDDERVPRRPRKTLWCCASRARGGRARVIRIRQALLKQYGLES